MVVVVVGGEMIFSNNLAFSFCPSEPDNGKQIASLGIHLNLLVPTLTYQNSDVNLDGLNTLWLKSHNNEKLKKSKVKRLLF